jgi:purine-cytosine permease-like protein
MGSFEQIRSYFGVIAPVLLNLISMIGFCILDCILGGQTLAAVADGSLSWRWFPLLFLQRRRADCSWL